MHTLGILEVASAECETDAQSILAGLVGWSPSYYPRVAIEMECGDPATTEVLHEDNFKDLPELRTCIFVLCHSSIPSVWWQAPVACIKLTSPQSYSYFGTLATVVSSDHKKPRKEENQER